MYFVDPLEHHTCMSCNWFPTKVDYFYWCLLTQFWLFALDISVCAGTEHRRKPLHRSQEQCLAPRYLYGAAQYARQQLSPPAKWQLSPPAKWQLSTPAKWQLSTPVKWQLSIPAKWQRSSPAKWQRSSPAKRQLKPTTKRKLQRPAKWQICPQTKWQP